MSESIRIREVFCSAEVTVIALEAARSYSHCSGWGCHAYLSISPVALLILSASQLLAVDVNGDPVDIEKLRRSAPDLDQVLRTRQPSAAPDRSVF
ncbi:MAG: hypothetical protein HKN70_11595 [Gammaproteobacteria bacterium]|nr:hypothetical protein [Gammaproteobacteria bacterium]